jgi:Flp pilus assembly pilin Flp
MYAVLNFLRSEEAVSVTEYAIMLGLIVLGAVGAISGIGSAVANAYAVLDSGVNSVI